MTWSLAAVEPICMYPTCTCCYTRYLTIKLYGIHIEDTPASTVSLLSLLSAIVQCILLSLATFSVLESDEHIHP